MSTDFDIPRDLESVQADEAESLRVLTSLPAARGRGLDADEVEATEPVELAGADLSGEVLTVAVVPMQADEFTCGRCHLIQHTRLRATSAGICRDCA